MFRRLKSAGWPDCQEAYKLVEVFAFSFLASLVDDRFWGLFSGSVAINRLSNGTKKKTCIVLVSKLVLYLRDNTCKVRGETKNRGRGKSLKRGVKRPFWGFTPLGSRKVGKP